MKKLAKRIPNKLKTPKDFSRLNTLARAIRDGHEATEKLIKSSKDKAREALNEAILTGKALIEAKEILGFGKFGRWLKEHCKNISERTCRNYMSLHNAFGQNRQHVAELPITNLRKAYLQLGIINEPTADAAKELPVASSQSSRKQLTNGETMESAPQVDSVQAAQLANPGPRIPIVEAEIVENKSPKDKAKANALFKARGKAQALLIDLFNMIEAKQFTADELSTIFLDPQISWFAASRKIPAPLPKF